MSDPLASHVLAVGDQIAQTSAHLYRGTVVKVLPFKKPIYEVEFPDTYDDSQKEIFFYRASLTKKGRAGKEFVQVSKEDGGRWAMVENSGKMIRVDATLAVPSSQPPIAAPGTDEKALPNPYCKCEEKHPPNVTHCETQ